MSPRRLLRKLSRRLAVRRLLPSGPPPAWWQEVIRCQDIIAASEPHPYYLQAYRREEIWCWIHIAKWLWEDGRERRPRRCLDIGCAYGTLSLYCRRLFSCQVSCTDCTDRYLSSALVRQQGLTFAQSNIELDTPLWGADFDVVLFTEVLEHLNFHPVPTLRKIAGLLAEGGRLYLSTPDAAEWGRLTKYYASVGDIPQPEAGLARVDDHVYHYSRAELADVVAAAGLRVERWSYSPGASGRHHNLALVKAL